MFLLHALLWQSSVCTTLPQPSLCGGNGRSFVFIYFLMVWYDQLEFGTELSVTAMVSSESERVPLAAPVYTKQAAGRVEIWLLQVCVAENF